MTCLHDFSCCRQDTEYVAPPPAMSPAANPAAPVPWQDQDKEKDDLEKDDDGATWRDGDSRRRQPRVSIVATGGAHLAPIRWDDCDTSQPAKRAITNHRPVFSCNFLLCVFRVRTKELIQLGACRGAGCRPLGTAPRSSRWQTSSRRSVRRADLTRSRNAAASMQLQVSSAWPPPMPSGGRIRLQASVGKRRHMSLLCRRAAGGGVQQSAWQGAQLVAASVESRGHKETLLDVTASQLLCTFLRYSRP